MQRRRYDPRAPYDQMSSGYHAPGIRPDVGLGPHPNLLMIEPGEVNPNVVSVPTMPSMDHESLAEEDKLIQVRSILCQRCRCEPTHCIACRMLTGQGSAQANRGTPLPVRQCRPVRRSSGTVG